MSANRAMIAMLPDDRVATGLSFGKNRTRPKNATSRRPSWLSWYAHSPAPPPTLNGHWCNFPDPTMAGFLSEPAFVVSDLRKPGFILSGGADPARSALIKTEES